MDFSLKSLVAKFFGNNKPTQQVMSSIKTAIAVYGTGNATANIRDGYANNADNYAIVRRIAKTAAMIPIYAYRIKDKQKLKEYDLHLKSNGFTAQWLIKAQTLKRQAIEQLPDNHPMQMIIDKPNPLYDKTEFTEGFYIFRLLTGNTYLYTPRLDFGKDAGKVTEMWLMPSNYVQPKVAAATFPREIEGYQFTLCGVEQLSKDEVLHSRYFNPVYGYMGEELVGLSPLTAGLKILTRSNDEVDYSVAAFQNSGISGIVTNESVSDASPETLGQLKKDFYNEASGTKNARKLLFQAGKINYVQIGLSPVDMDLLESEKLTFKKLCNLYGVSDILFNVNDSSTESNVKEMIRQLYTNAALPEVYAYRDLLNKGIAPQFNTNNEQYFYDCDLTAITELQQDMVKMAEVLNKMPVMIPNVAFEMMGLSTSEDEAASKIYIKNDYTPLEDLSINVPNLP